MSGAAHYLADASRLFRRRIDDRSMPAHLVRRQLARLGRELLRRYPDDAELWRAFTNLRDGRFHPPQEVELPSGCYEEVLEGSWSIDGEEAARLAGRLLEVPDPAAAIGEARAVMELLLLAPNEGERTQALLAALAPYEEPSRLGLWAFRSHLRFGHGLGEPGGDDWAAWLDDPARTKLADLSEARLHRIGATERLKELDAHGSDWLMPVCGGYVVGGWEMATRRRPALREEAPDIARWLGRAREVASTDALDYTPLERQLLQMEEADATGSMAEGTQWLLGLLEAYPANADLVRLASARARLLLDPTLAARLEADYAESFSGEWPEIGGFVAPAQAPPDLPTNLCERAARLGENGHCEDDGDRALLEMVGAKMRALMSWLEIETPQAMMQAARIAVGAGDVARKKVREALLNRVPSDERMLAEDEGARALALWLLELLDNDGDRFVWGLRLAASAPDQAPSLQPPAGAEGDSDDPHAPANRLAAAEDLLAEGLIDGAAAIAASLLKHPTGPQLISRFVRLVQDLFRSTQVPLSLIEVVGRHVHAGGAVAMDLLAVFIDDPRAAHPMLDVLHSIGRDRECPEVLRLNCLQAWLGVWQATDTLPTDELIRPFMRRDAHLLLLSHGRLTGAPDPVAAAAHFLEQYPPLEHPPSTWIGAFF